ncbi:hypothetical protein [Micromonospora costi]|uniref:Uncharacterized protein n=1 Tax=Micromonospora costi TaxID=1530042 RepID=A0A3B0A4S6_9ACTN|nr:hypothetical protein [Micromonospora costi]RKN55461.1 hypothetical protein D7193_12475 [Micromonospora costi]
MGTIVWHAVGAAVAWLVFTLEGLLGYLVLLGYALVTDSDPGGPLAGPLVVPLAALAGVIVVPLLVLPAALLGDLMARRQGRFLGALVGGGGAMLLAALCAVVVALATDVPAAGALLAGLVAALAVVPPLAAHAATARATRTVAQRFRRPRATPVGEKASAGASS